MEINNNFTSHKLGSHRLVKVNTLPTVIKSDFKQLSPQAKEEIRKYMGARPLSFIVEVHVAWLVIFTAICAAILINNLWVTAIAVIVVATRQNILGLLVHEQSHYLASRKKWADTIVNIFVAWPLLLLSVERYAKVHLAHHSYYFTENDPDFLRKNGKTWVFPMKRMALLKIFIKDLLGLNLYKMIKGKNKEIGIIKRKEVAPKWFKFLYFFFVVSLISYFHLWSIIFIFWVIPLITVLQCIVRWGAICEHKYNVLSTKIEDSSAIIILKWWEKILLPNLNFNYHIYHHYFPGISFKYLPHVHRIFQKEGLINEKNIFNGYFEYFKFLQKQNNKDHSNSTNHSDYASAKKTIMSGL